MGECCKLKKAFIESFLLKVKIVKNQAVAKKFLALYVTSPSAGGRRALQDKPALKSTLYIQTMKSSIHLVLTFPFFLLYFCSISIHIFIDRYCEVY